MPRYDYKCINCESEFELVQSFSEAGSGVCPLCSGAGRRVFHAVPVIYKGSGFYTTDYGRPKRTAENGAKETKETSDSKSSTSDSSSDSSSSGSSSSDSSSSDAKESKATESASGSSESMSKPAAKSSSEA